MKVYFDSNIFIKKYVEYNIFKYYLTLSINIKIKTKQNCLHIYVTFNL